MREFLKSLIFLVLAAVWLNVLGQDQKGAIWIPSQHHRKGRDGKTAKWLIIHGTAFGSSAREIASWFQNSTSQVSSHYIVDQAGEVVQCVREADTAWANGRIESGADSWWAGNGNPNQVTISIEHVKSSTDNSNQLTIAQKNASFNLIRDIIRRHSGIRKAWANAQGGITGHYSISAQSRKYCPGPYPWNEMFTHLGGSQSDGKCHGTVTASKKIGLRIRAQPNTSSNMIGSLARGQRVTLSGRTTGQNVKGNSFWFHYGNGYVSGKYIQLEAGGPSWCHN